MSINLKNIGLISLFFISPKKVQIKSGQSPFAFYAGEPLEHIFPDIFPLDKCL